MTLPQPYELKTFKTPYRTFWFKHDSDYNDYFAMKDTLNDVFFVKIGAFWVPEEYVTLKLNSFYQTPDVKKVYTDALKELQEIKLICALQELSE